MLPAGTPLHVETGSRTFPLLKRNTLDPRKAASNVLAAYLRSAVFNLNGGTDVDKTFQLENVRSVWPDPDEQLEYPSAAITEPKGTPYEAHSLTPTAVEEDWVPECGGVLWKTAEAVCSFQVDFWADNDPVIEAMGATIPSLFNPGEGYAGVRLSGDHRYFCAPVRATLLEHQRMETPGAMYENERRLRTIVRCEIDVIHLRVSTELNPMAMFPVGDL